MSGVDASEFHECLRRADAAAELIAFVRRIANGLTFADRFSLSSRSVADATDPPVDLAKRGWAELPRASEPTPLAVAIDELHRARLSPLWMYLANEPWDLGDQLRARLSKVLRREYRLLADVWAWFVPPGARGWPPHRGIDKRILDRTAPEILNVWVALDDVEVDRAAMHFVSLEDDPSYPERLGSIDVRDGEALVVPVPAGTALVWNANILHWGGACSPTARGPRRSCSFSLVREDAMAESTIPALRLDELDLPARVDLLAAQIVTYGEGQPGITPEVLAWARANYTLRAVLDRRTI